MIKKLRQKFVFVTMCMLVVTFSIFFIVDHSYVKYWEEQDTLKLLEWYANSDSFFDAVNNSDENTIFTVNPIFSITLSPDLEVIHILSSAKIHTWPISQDTIERIFEKPVSNHKYGSYIYIAEKTDDFYYLMITDSCEKSKSFTKLVGDFFLVLIALVILLSISFLLSRFVTEPARLALEREKQFISDASHELKTPLAAISINAEALKSEIKDNRYLEYILSETKRMDVLIKKLLKLSYLDENESMLEKHDFSLSDCMEEMILTLESSLFEKNINLDYHIIPDIPYHGNEAELKQVIAILLDNAMKNTPPKGSIFFSLSIKNRHPLIIVENTGNGISKEDLPHIFDRFYKSDVSRNSNSYGLGLAIAKAIVDAHEGSISVTSVPGKSTTFTILL